MHSRIVSLIIIILSISGCFIKDPMVKKELFSQKITKPQLSELKETIESLGYFRGSREDYQYEGAYVTHYFKYVGARVDKNLVQISMSFKTKDLNSDFYRNFGFTVSSVDPQGNEEIIAEINFTEDIIKTKLIELVGVQNTERRRPMTNWSSPYRPYKW